MSENQQTHSIMIHLRRATIGDAYVSVKVTDDIIKKDDAGSFDLDFDALIAKAVQSGHDPHTEWKIESSSIEPHPIQCPKPDDRQYLQT